MTIDKDEIGEIMMEGFKNELRMFHGALLNMRVMPVGATESFCGHENCTTCTAKIYRVEHKGIDRDDCFLCNRSMYESYKMIKDIYEDKDFITVEFNTNVVIPVDENSLFDLTAFLPRLIANWGKYNDGEALRWDHENATVYIDHENEATKRLKRIPPERGTVHVTKNI